MLDGSVIHGRPHDYSTTTTMTTYTTQPQGLALWWLINVDESSPRCVPARTPTVHWGRYDGRPWVARPHVQSFLITHLIRFPRSIVTLVGNRSAFLPIFLFQHSHSTFVIILFWLFCRLFIILTMCEWAPFSKPTTTLGLVEQAFWTVTLFSEWIGANSPEVILAGPSIHSSTWLLLLGFLVLDAFLTAQRSSEDRFGCVIFARLSTSWRKLQLSPLEHCPVASHSSHNFHFCSQNSYFEYLAQNFSSPQFSICDNQVLTSSDESPGHTIPIRSKVSQTLVFLICTILPRCHRMGFSV